MQMQHCAPAQRLCHLREPGRLHYTRAFGRGAFRAYMRAHGLHGVHLDAPCPAYHGVRGMQDLCVGSTTLHLVKMLALSAPGIKLAAFCDSGRGCLVQLSLGVRCVHMRLALS